MPISALSDRWYYGVEGKCLYDTEWDVRITESVEFQARCRIDAAAIFVARRLYVFA